MSRSLAVLLALAACAGTTETDSGDDRTELTCEVLADPGFCWAVAVEEAYACIPEADSSGTFDASRTTCTLGSGITVVFDDPVPADPFADEADDYLWSFTVNDGGGECVRFSDSDTDYGLTTASGTAETRSSGFGVELECPDGEVFYQGDFFSLMECEQEVILPGYSYSGNISWSLLGAPDGRFSLFECQ